MARGWVAVTCCAGALWAAADASAQSPPRIAYGSAGEVRLISPDGSDRATFTATPSGYDSFSPAWSSDGGAIGFVRKTDPDDDREVREVSQLIVARVDGAERRVVARDAGYGGLSFSPDGRSIVYSATVLVGGEEYTESLRVIGADGSAPRALTQPDANVSTYSPAWSPDGATIAFTRFKYTSRGGVNEIWSVPSAGGAGRRLVADADNPAWSPDGTRIAFATARDRNGETCFHECSPNREIYVMDADGANATRITRTTTDEGSPAWSPDGSQIAFDSGRPDPGDNHELYVMRADGTCPMRLTNTSVSNIAPQWRPGPPYAAELVCDGAAPGALEPVMETDLSDAKRVPALPLAWLGPSYEGLLLSGVDVGNFPTLIYDDCGLVGQECALGELQVQTASSCRRHPLSYGGYLGPGEPDHSPHVERYRRVGNALLADLGPESGSDLYTGAMTVTLFEPGFATAAAIAKKLTVFPGSRSVLAPPRFSAQVLSRVRSVRRELRRHGLRELSRRWRMSPDQIRSAVKLRGVLRASELRTGTRCSIKR